MQEYTITQLHVMETERLADLRLFIFNVLREQENYDRYLRRVNQAYKYSIFFK